MRDPIRPQAAQECAVALHASAWIDENNDEYPDAVIESVDPNIDYYKRYDGESLMEGEIEVTLSFHRDASSAELPL